MKSILLDATRLFIRGSRYSPTGIDRVVLAYARWLLGRPGVSLQPVVTAGGQVWRAPRALLAKIVDGSETFGGSEQMKASADWAALVRALDEPPGFHPPIRAKSVAAQFPARALWHGSLFGAGFWRLRPLGRLEGSLYVNVSHTGLGDPRVLGRVANKGARSVVMMHDLIPITHPEYCSPSAKARHIRRVDNILDHAALVISNSQATAIDLAAYARSLGRTCPPVKIAPLGLEKAFLKRAAPLRPDWPYFVCVGTLEARKNLTFLLALWRRLDERLGADAPRLILVGRRGWENESVLDHLQRSEAVARLVHEVSDLQDAELAQLIAGARALLAPSFAEGYDLPVVEAMSVGTPVIASDIPVHQELASVARLIDPLDGPAWLAAIEAAGDAQPPTYTAPTWEDHFTSLADTIVGNGAAATASRG